MTESGVAGAERCGGANEAEQRVADVLGWAGEIATDLENLIEYVQTPDGEVSPSVLPMLLDASSSIRRAMCILESAT